jgi:hypothetical protein
VRICCVCHINSRPAAQLAEHTYSSAAALQRHTEAYYSPCALMVIGLSLLVVCVCFMHSPMYKLHLAQQKVDSRAQNNTQLCQKVYKCRGARAATLEIQFIVSLPLRSDVLCNLCVPLRCVCAESQFSPLPRGRRYSLSGGWFQI